MDHTVSSPEDLFTTSRLTGLHAHRSGTLVATVQQLDDDAAVWQPVLRLLAVPGGTPPASPQGGGAAAGGSASAEAQGPISVAVPPTDLTRPGSRASVLDVAEDGTVYVSLVREEEKTEDPAESIVWALPPRGEARPVLVRAGGIDSLAARGNRLVVVAHRLSLPSEEEHARATIQRRKSAASAILHESFPSRYWDHDLGPGTPTLYVADAAAQDSSASLRRILLPEGRLEEVRVDPVGRRAAVTLVRNRRGIHQRSVVALVDLDSPEGAGTRILAEPASEGGDPALESVSYRAGEFSPDGTRLLLAVERHSLPGQSLHVGTEVMDLATGHRGPVAPELDRWVGDPVWWDERTLAFVTDHHGRTAVHATRLGESGAWRLSEDGFHYSALQVCGDHLVALRDAVDRSPDVVRLDLPEHLRASSAPTDDGGEHSAGDPTVLTASGRDSTLAAELAHLDEIPSGVPVLRGAGELEEITARAEDGTDLRAWLCRPAGDGPFPLLVFVHGGPWGSWNSWTYRWNPWPFVGAGYAVLLPDPALSTGYGQQMIDRGTDGLGAAPYTDILALADAALQRTDLDAERTALLGGSYGGYMANWMAGHTGRRFRCIVSHASLWNVEAMAVTTDNGAWQEWLVDRGTTLGAENSPHRFVDQVAVPMLVIHGDKDYRVPISQGQSLWGDLLRHGPELGHQYLYFPDEGHWILRPANSLLWYQTVLAFLDRHVRDLPWVRPGLLG